jgi:hypothetical protein
MHSQWVCCYVLLWNSSLEYFPVVVWCKLLCALAAATTEPGGNLVRITDKIIDRRQPHHRALNDLHYERRHRETPAIQ